MKTLQIAIAFLLFGIVPMSALSNYNHQNQDVPLSPSKRVEKLIAEYDNEETPGGVILVMRDGEVIFDRAFGMANLTYGVPFSVETPTNIGSTSKQFTAFAIGLLEEQGKLSIDDDIRDYIPELPDFGETVRLWHLISHTSGYREYLNTLVMGGRHLGDHVSSDEVVPMIQRQPKLQNTPGDAYNYNNTGYALLAMVVEKVTEQDFPSWMKENVFLPLGMENTTVLDHRGRVIPGSAQGYGRDEKENFVKLADLSGSMGPGGIYSTVEDLVKWVQNFYKPSVGSKSLIDKMQTSFVKNDGDSLGYGFGLTIDEKDGLRRVHHGGADIAHRSEFYMFPDIKGAVITQSNNSGFPGSVALRVAEAFFVDVMDLDEEKPQDPESFEYVAENFDEIVGRYAMEDMPSFVMEFSREGDTLFTQATGQGRVQIYASSDSTFYLTIVDAGFTFHRNENGEIDAMTLHQNGDHRAKRIFEPKWVPSEEELEMYQGRYFSEELETFYTIVAIEDGSLVLRHRRFDDIPLRAEAKDDYTGSFPITGLRFIRDEDDKVTGFRASSGRSFGIIFEKQ